MSESELVHFDGDWNAEERKTIRDAVRDFEAETPLLEMDFGPPWVATRHAFPSFELFMATRLGVARGFVGQNVDLLAEQIRMSGREEADGEQEEQAGGEVPAEREATEEADVFWLVYQSRAQSSMTEDDLHSLLQQSRAKNERLGITGVLLYQGEQFMQVLEGEESVVLNLYRTIRADARHEDITTICFGSVRQRAFPDWRMGMERLDEFEDEAGTTTFLQGGSLPDRDNMVMEVKRALEQFRAG